MRQVIDLDIAQVMPQEPAVLERIGVPAGADVSDNVMLLSREAADRIVRAARPRAVVQRVTVPAVQRMYRGDGWNSDETPLDEILPRAEAVALFVATIGPAPGDEIHTLFHEGDPALAVMLDAYSSEMTNLVVEELARRFSHEVRDGSRVLPYSPGYCGWHVSGQRALFAAVEPVEIDVTLRPSCLMTPIKSVSGVLVAGDEKTHRFRPRWTFCDECIGRDCGPRMASVR